MREQTKKCTDELENRILSTSVNTIYDAKNNSILFFEKIIEIHLKHIQKTDTYNKTNI